MTIYEQAIAKWGIAAQVTQTMGECGELVAALNRFFFQGSDDIEAVIDEVADVRIMLNQIAHIVGPRRVDKRVITKLEGIKKKLEASDD